MKRKNDIKLDAISGIDKGIVDEATDMRISLSRRAHRALLIRRRFISATAAAACLFLIIGVLFSVILPLISSDAPVYQGMTVRKENAVTADSGANNLLRSKRLAPFLRIKDNHQGHDQELENSINDLVTIDVIADREVKYYVEPGERFIIEVHLSNPNDYEIQSFTLNGQKYANYMFKEGSTMELLLLEMTAPEEPGYIEYTIDAIKYIDGTEIKDVDMSSGDKSVKVGIEYDTPPSVSITSQSVFATSFELSLNVSDKYSLIGKNELSLYLSDGNKIIAQKPLKIGENTVSFSDLNVSKTYAYGVVAVFDQVDGRNLHAEWLLTGTVTMGKTFSIIDITPLSDSVRFNVLKTGELGEITSISIYDAVTNELAFQGSADTTEFTGLLSNHRYNLYVDYSYTVNGKEISDWVSVKDIKTLSKAAPEINFDQVAQDKSSVNYSASAIDPDGTLTEIRVELLLGGVSVKNNGSSLEGVFSDLLSDNEYTVKITYSYDLGDGNGIHTEVLTKNIATAAKEAPTLSLDDISSTKTSVSYTASLSDSDGTLTDIKVELLRGGVSVKNNGSTLEGSFEDLLSSSEYTVRITYRYDLNNGKGEVSKAVSESTKTQVKIAPSVVFGEASADKTSVSYSALIIDPDNTLTDLKAELILDGKSVQTGSALEGRFEGLISGKEYTVRLTYIYDLNDGKAPITENVSKKLETPVQILPTVVFESTSSDKTSVTYSVSVLDPDNILTSTKVELLRGGVSVKNNGSSLKGKFEGLASDTLYTLKISYTYALNQSQGEVTKSVTKDIQTLSTNAPSVLFDGITVTDSAIKGTLKIDESNGSGGNITSAELLKGGSSIKKINSNKIDFSGLEPYTTYEMAVTYSYTPQGGTGSRNETAIYYITTNPSLTLNACSIINPSATFGEGETIYLQMNISNPQRVVLKKVVVNGNEYNVVSISSNSNEPYCEIVNNGQLGGGDVTLKVEKIICELDGKAYTVDLKTNNTVSVNIFKLPEVIRLDTVVLKDGEYIPVDYVFKSEEFNLLLTLDNKSKVNVDKIKVSVTTQGHTNTASYFETVKLDDEHYLISVDRFSGVIKYNVTEITYSHNETTKIVSTELFKCITALTDDEIHPISTPDDLLNMSGTRYYELKNDIDLSGINWVGNEFTGVFDGKGYSIKNMTYIGSKTGALGLFTKSSGVIKNLHMESVKIIVDSTSSLYVGSISSHATDLILENCSIDENSMINVKTMAGGLIGLAMRVTVRNCSNGASVSGNFVGGISCTTINSQYINCQNYGNLSGITSTGCIASYVVDHTNTITNCVGYNDISMISTFGDVENTTVENCHVLGDNASASELNSKKFYTDTLGWSEEIWDLDDLDIENGKYPKLKR